MRQREEKKRQKEQEEADRIRKEAEEEALEKQREKDELLAKIAAQDAEKKRIEAEERSKLGLFGQLMGRKPAPSSSAAKPPRPIRDKDHAATRIQMLFLINSARLRAHRKRMAIAKGTTPPSINHTNPNSKLSHPINNSHQPKLSKLYQYPYNSSSY